MVGEGLIASSEVSGVTGDVLKSSDSAVILVERTEEEMGERETTCLGFNACFLLKAINIYFNNKQINITHENHIYKIN